jgi:hypothetical protein
MRRGDVERLHARDVEVGLVGLLEHAVCPGEDAQDAERGPEAFAMHEGVGFVGERDGEGRIVFGDGQAGALVQPEGAAAHEVGAAPRLGVGFQVAFGDVELLAGFVEPACVAERAREVEAGAPELMQSVGGLVRDGLFEQGERRDGVTGVEQGSSAGTERETGGEPALGLGDRFERGR